VSEQSFASFGEDEDGELYALDLYGGRVLRLEAGPGSVPSPPPERLSETGCFSELASLSPVDGVLGYEVALPFWSDGAAKRRFVVLPEGRRITPSQTAPFSIPTGTVFIKHFELGAGGAAPAKPIETRFLVQEASGVRGFTYRWDAAGGDATLFDGADAARFAVTDPAGAAHDWILPSRGDCTTCHRGAGALGLDSHQLGDAIATFAELDLFEGALPTPAPHPAPDDATVPLEARARAWLHVNCAYCHDGGGIGGTPLDLRADTPLAATAACDRPPWRGDLGVADARIIAPGAPERSVLWLRASARDEHGMPPLATTRVDPDGTLVRDWIAMLEGACP
jgi:uncharacterized repeat protein (TIGR03806 family)